MDAAILAAVALLIMLFGAISLRAERWPLSPAIFFIAAGFVLSERGLGFLEFDLTAGGVHLLVEITLVVVLFTDASRIDLSCLRREGGLPLRLLGIGLPLTVLLGTGIGMLLFPGFGILEAALLAAILAPTDAALGQAVVSSHVVPLRIRQTLNIESGLNDGLVLPLVLVLASWAGATEGSAAADNWLTFTAVAIVGGVAVGVAVGWAGGTWLERGVASGWVNPVFQRLSALGMAILAFAGAELLGGNGFIAAFIAGLAFGNVGRNVCDRLHQFAETEGQLLTLSVFLIFGAVMVPEALNDLTLAVVGYGLLSLTVIRMAPVAFSLLGSDIGPKGVAFLAWFGPRGLASILFVLLVVEAGLLPTGPLFKSIVVITVLLSAILHGLTAYPFSAAFGNSSEGESYADGPQPEMVIRPRIVHSQE